MKLKVIKSVATAAVVALASSTAMAQDSLPSTVVWTTYDTGGAMHTAAVAISSALKQSEDVNLRVLIR